MPGAPRRSPVPSVSRRHRIETLPADWHPFFLTHVGRLRYIPGDQAVAEEVAEAVAEGIGGGDSLLFAPAEARARAAAVLREAVDHSRPTILASEGALVGEMLPERVPQPRQLTACPVSRRAFGEAVTFPQRWHEREPRVLPHAEEKKAAGRRIFVLTPEGKTLQVWKPPNPEHLVLGMAIMGSQLLVVHGKPGGHLTLSALKGI